MFKKIIYLYRKYLLVSFDFGYLNMYVLNEGNLYELDILKLDVCE